MFYDMQAGKIIDSREEMCKVRKKTHIEKKSKGEKIIILISFQLFAAIEWDFSLWLNWSFNWLPLPFLASLELWIVLIQQPTTVSVERNSSLLFICLIIISLFRFDKFFRQLECYKFENFDKRVRAECRKDTVASIMICVPSADCQQMFCSVHTFSFDSRTVNCHDDAFMRLKNCSVLHFMFRIQSQVTLIILFLSQ